MPNDIKTDNLVAVSKTQVHLAIQKQIYNLNKPIQARYCHYISTKNFESEVNVWLQFYITNREISEVQIS